MTASLPLRCVVDASTAIKVVMVEPLANQAKTLLNCEDGGGVLARQA